MARLSVVADADALAEESAERLTTHLARAIGERGAAIVSLTGGRTPTRMFHLLGDPARPWRARIDWRRLHLFWGDERHVSPEHPDSNFGMANAALLAHVPIPAAHVHRIRAELPNAADAARDYERTLRDGFARAGRADQTFDVMLLGVGDDAHIASVFPGSPLLASVAGQAPEYDRVAALWVPHLAVWRISLTPAALLDADAIIVIASGVGKANAVRAALELSEDIERWPVQVLRHAGDRVEWIIDRAAAAHVRALISDAIGER